jgi:hypothetical protein
VRICERCNQRTAETRCPYCKIAICDECLDTVHVPCPVRETTETPRGRQRR